MKKDTTIPAFAGNAYKVTYQDLVAHNIYSEDGKTVRYEIVAGPYTGANGASDCEWDELTPGVFAISWQEDNGSTVVHVDDFNAGRTKAYFTTPDLKFYRMIGDLELLAI